MAREMLERWEELIFFSFGKIRKAEGDGEEEEAGFQHQPHFVCVSFPWMLDSDVVLTHLRRREKLFLFFFYYMSFFLFDIYFDSPCCCCSHHLVSFFYFYLLRKELLHPSSRVLPHKHVCDVISNGGGLGGYLFFFFFF